MRTLFRDGWCVPLLAIVILAAWALPAAATDPDSLKIEQEEAKKARRILIRDGKVLVDEGIVIELDEDQIKADVDRALEEAKKAIEALEVSDVRYRKVHRSDVFRMGEDIVIEADEMVTGNVVSVLGNVRIEGKVTGDVVAVLGNLDLGESAVVNGEAVSVMGHVEEAPGATVRGQTVSVGTGVIGPKLGKCCFPLTFHRSWWVIGSLVAIAMAVLVTLLVALIFREGVGRVNAAIRRDVLKSWLYGLLFEIVLVVLTVLLAITIIGIPLAILLWLVVGLATLWAFAGVSLRMGEAMFGGQSGPGSRVGLVFVGALVILAVSIVARILSLVGGLFWGPALGIRILGSLITWFALTTGLGAVWMTRFGTREANGKARPAAPAAGEGQAQPA